MVDLGTASGKERHFFKTVFLSVLVILFLLKPASAKSEKYSTEGMSPPEIDRTFNVEGDKFTYREMETGTISVWEGNVKASSSQITIQTGKLELNLSDGDKVKSIKAGPQVLIELREDEGSARISGKMFEYDFETQTGRVDNSIIELNAKPEAFDLPEGYTYLIFILSDKVNMDKGDLIVEYPELRLNSLDNPQVKIRGRELTIKSIGNDRRMRIRQVSVNVFGRRVFYFPWSYDKSIAKKAAGGFSSDPPIIGYDKSGVEFDQRFFYTFMNPPLENKALIARFDIYTNDRWFPEIMLSDMGGEKMWDLKYGWERLDNHQRGHVRVFKNPDFNLRLPEQVVFKRFILSSGADWGQLEEPGRDAKSKRLGLHAGLARKPIQLGNSKATLQLEGDWREQFYENNEKYSVLSGSIGIKQVEKGEYSLALTYYHREVKGQSPFLHDVDDIQDELKLRSRKSFSRSWSGGFDTRYDLNKMHFRELQLITTRIYDSFQVSFKWDFADSNFGVEFGFPGVL